MINLNHYTESGDDRFEFLSRWRESGKLEDAKRAFSEIVECKATVPQDLAEAIVSSLTVKGFKLPVAKQRNSDIATWIMIYEEKGWVVNMTDIFKRVAKESGDSWQTVEKGFYGKKGKTK